MDGQRRVSEPLAKRAKALQDCPRKYRVFARSSAVLLLLAVIAHGVISGGHLSYPGSPFQKVPGQLGAMFGLIAKDIELTGLQHHDAREVLELIGIKPGGTLLGFDAKKARIKLQELDWVDSATVVRRFPNQLKITIAEREPFVVWQNAGKFYVVDQKGRPMTGVSPHSKNILLQVVGAGANTSAAKLVNEMEATRALMQGTRAAVRVGDRRWDLHMNNGLIIALPEWGGPEILKDAEVRFLAHEAQASRVKRIDYRMRGRVAFQADNKLPDISVDPTTTSSIQ
jgi:cell division protein FtsQ